MRYSICLVAMGLSSQLLGACNDSSGPSVAPHVDAMDECDPASFNAALGAGTCTRNGSVTLAQFNAELTAQHSVAAWHFAPTTLTARVGDAITVTNRGGEVHTFTEVENFGGGIVPSLNTASGNPTEAPECGQLQAEDFIQAGTTVTDERETTAGTEKYQCCIHPWMRATVTVSAR
jgi:plastocyanin